MLQMNPEKDVVMEFIRNQNYKYIRAMGVFFLRLTGNAKEIYETLEPYYADYRRLAFREISGQFSILHMDELIDKLLRDENFCEINLPRITKRYILEEDNEIKPYVSQL